MRVLITGVTGFAGSHLAEYLLNVKSVELWGTIRCRSKTENIEHLSTRINLVECDIREAGLVRSVIERVIPDYIFHLASHSFVANSWDAPSETLATNINGTLNIFEAVRSLGISPRIHLACSSEEYGLVHAGELPVRESNPLRPLSPYAVSKAAADLLAFQYVKSHRLDIVRTRAFNHTGPRHGDALAASAFAKQIAEIEVGIRPPVIKVGNLKAVRDFSDVRDVVRAYCLCLERGKVGEVYNVSTGTGLSIQQVLNALFELSGCCFTVQQDPQRLRPSDVPVMIGDSTLFRRETGWQPEIPFTQTMRDLLDFWRLRVRVSMSNDNKRKATV